MSYKHEVECGPTGAAFFMELLVRGNDQEQKAFTEVHSHYALAKQDLEQRIRRSNGFDDADKMFASYIDESNWPYSSMIYDPRPYTMILEKSARLIGAKPKGRLVPREGGDTLGAYINNELLSFEWDDNVRLGESMVSKWIMMDQNARKYGSSFAMVKWRWEQRVQEGKKVTFYDAPDMMVCDPRNVLANPSYTYINKWFQYREYPTYDELRQVNDAARTAPTYKNLDILRDTIKEQTNKGARGDNRSTQYMNQNKSMRGLDDFMGRDEVYKPIEIVTEYRADRWITIAVRQGVVIRDIPNPYKHGEIPVVQLKYYPLPDDLYGNSELEPVAKLVKGLNAHLSAYSDRAALRLRPPLHVNAVNVKMHTLEWTPEAKWLMNKPGEDVQMMNVNAGEDGAFQNIYNVFLGAMQTAVGEQSQGYSNVNPMDDQGRVTATEIKMGAFTRNVRDNMNQIFLSEALKKQIMFWHSMNQQFMFSTKTDQVKILRIVGRDAVEFFNRQGLSDVLPTDQDVADEMGDFQEPYIPGPRFPVEMGGEVKPKFEPDVMGEGGNLYIEPGDLLGTYDYIPDIESMKAPSDEEQGRKLNELIALLVNPAIGQMLAAEGKRPKISEIIIKAMEATKVIKDADAYFESLPGGGVNESQIIQGGVAGAAGGVPGQGSNGANGMAKGGAPMAPGQNTQFMGGPPAI